MTTVIAATAILIQSFIVLLAADFAAGIIHWVEDAYVREDTPLIGKVIGRPNVIHHHLPRHMTRKNWLQSSWDLCLISAAIVFAAGLLGVLTWHVWLFALISANANQVHKWSHRTRRENGPLITLLQNLRLVQTPHHHAIHHTDPKNVHYCPVTNFLNPVLDRSRFWDALEWLLAKTIRLHRRPDTSLADSGPRPEWIAELGAGSRLAQRVASRPRQSSAGVLTALAFSRESAPYEVENKS